MPRHVTPSENRWLHPHYRKAYCYKYGNGLVYTVVDSVRKATGYVWKPENKKACMRLLEQRLIDTLYSKTDIPVVEHTVLDLVQRFQRDIVSKLNPETQRQYDIIYKRFLTVNAPLSDIGAIKLSLIDNMNEMELAPATLKKRLIRIKRIFNYGIELEWMEKNPVIKSMVPKSKKQEVIVSSESHLEKLIEYFQKLENPQMVLLIKFLRITAFRIQEAMDLQWDNINERNILIKGKGSRYRVFPIRPFPELTIVLNELKELNPLKPFNWLNQQTPAKSMRKAMVQLQKDNPETTWDITFHVIRKTTINMWKNRGVDTDVRNSIAGHTEDVESEYYLTDPDIEYLENKLVILSKM